MAGGRVLALDLGDARIGVAISDDARRVAVPYSTILTGPRWMEEVCQIVTDESIATLVVGLPLSMSGDIGPQAARVQRSCEELRAAVPVPVELQDERLSTVEAERRLGGAGVKGKKRRTTVDTTAAVVILEAFLARTKGS